MRLIGAHFLVLGGFLQALVDGETQRPQLAGKSLQDRGFGRAGRHGTKSTKQLRELAPRSRKAFLEGDRDRLAMSRRCSEISSRSSWRALASTRTAVAS